MSKLYDKYLYLKNKDNSKIYLFKSGIFFIALEDDALELAEKFNFKLTNLNERVIKCGFPEQRLNYYTNLLNIMNIQYELIYPMDSTNHSDSNNFSNSFSLKIIKQIANLDMNNISFNKAFEILYNLNAETKEYLNKTNLDD